MRYLTDNYWKEFQTVIIDTNGKSKTIKNGIKFENLVKDLLQLLYEGTGVTWTPTQTTHDGNKDFIGKSENDTFLWAECKNYKEKISMNVIAPTLVMAEIEDVREILVFSYSAINDSARKKLLYYADKRQKKIHFYDDINLENLIFRFRTRIVPKYFKDFPSSISIKDLISPFVFGFSMPGIHYSNIEDVSTSSFSIKLNDLIFAGVGIINNNFQTDLLINLNFGKLRDLEYLELLDNRFSNSESYNWNKKIKLLPGESKFIKLYFKLQRYKAELNLPTIYINFMDERLPSQEIAFKKILCSGFFSVPLMGSQYLDALHNLKDVTVNKGNLSLAIIHGRSGVGKSRILKEAVSIYIKYHYQILNFVADLSTNDSLSILREIIYFIYNLTPEMITESLKECAEKITSYGNDNIEIIKFLQELKFGQDVDISELLKKNQHFIFEKILSNKFTIIIDNIQFAAPFLINFIYDLCIYGKNYQRNARSVVIISYNNDYYCNPALKKFVIFAEEMKNSNCLHVFTYCPEGLNQYHQSLGFIKQLIQVKTDWCDSYFESIAKKANNIPKYIENTVEYLFKKGVLIRYKNYFTIRDFNIFSKEIESMPDSFKDVFHKRYKLFIINEKIEEKDAVLIFAAIHFFRNLTDYQVNQLRLNSQVMIMMEDYGFIKHEKQMRIWEFTHDLYEKYFVDTISLEDIFINYIINELKINCKLLPWQKLLIEIKNDFNIFTKSNEIIIKIEPLLMQVPYALKKYFYYKVIEYLSFFEDFSDINQYFAIVSKICLDAKNEMGTDISKILYKKIYDAFVVKSIKEREQYPFYQKFIYDYSEDLLQTNDSCVLQIYNERIRCLNRNFKKNYILLARLYNRIYVYYKHSKSEDLVHQYYKKSMDLCGTYQLIGMQIENLFDKGNYYLYVQNKRRNLISCWLKGIKIYKAHKNSLKYLTLNSLKKEIELELIRRNYNKVNKLLTDAFDYVENGEYNQQSLFFYSSLYSLKGVYGLISGQTDLKEIQETINMAEKYSSLLNNQKIYMIYLLYAKLAFKKKDYEDMLCKYSYALQKIEKDNAYYANIRNIILGDCTIKIGMLKNDLKELSFIQNQTLDAEINQKLEFINNLNITELRNYILNFKTVSNIADKSRKDGYIL